MYSCYPIFFLVTAIWPAYSLMRTIQGKVARLENGHCRARAMLFDHRCV